MTNDNNTAIDAIQIDEDVLTYTVSDEALEAAAGTERGLTERGLVTFDTVRRLALFCC
jgi:hypothetical protein